MRSVGRWNTRAGVRALLLAWVVGMGLGRGPALPPAVAQSVRVVSADRAGRMTWSGAPVPGVVSLDTAASLAGPWSPGANQFSLQSEGSLETAPVSGREFRRLWTVDLPPTRSGFTNLVRAYGLLETVAGNGAGQTDGVSYWAEWYEGGPAAWAALSRPHFAMADAAGRVYIADKNSHSVLRVDPEGLIHTHAGTHAGGFDGEGPAPATGLALNVPNGLWVRADGTVYVLDTGNGRVRRVGTNGVMQTLFLATSDGSELKGGRGLWVNTTETLAYVGAETRIRSWTPAGGLRTLASGFAELGLFVVEAGGDLVVCDRGANRVYRVRQDGSRTAVAGNGTATGGGDGQPALATGLAGVRGIWPFPTGGYLLLTHEGCQLWYWDASGTVHRLLHGAGGRTHAGDGEHFYSPDPRISEGRSVTIDAAGHLLVCESDWGYVRRIRFQRVPGFD